MKFKNLLTVNAVLFLAFGLGFIFLPSTLITLYGVEPVNGTIVTVQLYGGLLISIGLLSWFSRGFPDTMLQRAIQLSFMVGFAINTIVHILGTMSGVLNTLGWSAVIIYLFLTLGYAYFYFATPGRQAE